MPYATIITKVNPKTRTLEIQLETPKTTQSWKLRIPKPIPQTLSGEWKIEVYWKDDAKRYSKALKTLLSQTTPTELQPRDNGLWLCTTAPRCKYAIRIAEWREP